MKDGSIAENVYYCCRYMAIMYSPIATDVFKNCTTVRNSVLKPACKVSTFAVKIDLWEKLNFTGRFSCHSSNCVPKEDSGLRSGPIA